jgi:prolipoprotein diacylglyceryltransferase
MNRKEDAVMTMYDLANYASLLLVFEYNFVNIKAHEQQPYGRLRAWAEKRRNEGKCDIFSSDLFWVIIGILLVSAVQYSPAVFLGRPFGQLVGTGANYFALLYFAPILLLVYCWIMGVDPLRQIDIVAPAFPLALTMAKLGCYSAGCCGGEYCEFGLVNPGTGNREIPIQLIEAGVALALFVALEKSGKKLVRGTVFPVYLLAYSAIRFLTEFLRFGENLIWVWKTYQVLCLIGVALGIAEYYLVVTFGHRISSRFQHKQAQTNEK